MDAKLKTGQWTDGEEKISELFVLAQLDIWTSIATALALPSQAVPGMGRSELAEYVKREQAVYENFSRGGVMVLIYQDTEHGGSGAAEVGAVCAVIARAIIERIEELSQLGVAAGSDAEELAQLRENKQLCSSVLQLYQDAVSIKSIFDDVSHSSPVLKLW